MTYLQIKCFLMAAKYQSYSRAAESLYISQPTFSRQIQSLEEELNAELFVRNNNLMQLTSVGQEIYPEMESLFHNFDSTSKKMKELAANYSGRLVIGVQSGHPVDLPVGQAAKYVAELHPNANILVCHQYQNTAFNALMNGSLDAVLALEPTMPETPKLDSIKLYDDYFTLAVPAEHKNANLSMVCHKDVDKYFPDLKLYCVDAAEYDGEVSPGEKNPEDTLSCRMKYLTGTYASMDTLMMMVDTGLSMALFPSRYIMSYNQKIKLIPIKGTDAKGDEESALNAIATRIFWKKQHTNVILDEFLSYLRTLL